MRRALLGLALLSVAGCGGAGTDDVAAQDAALVAEGRELFAANCAECHGEDLRGTDQGPPFLSPIYEPGHHSDGAFLLAVQTGVRAHHWNFGDMPPVEGLSQEDVEAIVAFVRETQRIEGFEP